MVDSNLEGILVGIYTVERALSTKQDFEYLESCIPINGFLESTPEADFGNTRTNSDNWIGPPKLLTANH